MARDAAWEIHRHSPEYKEKMHRAELQAQAASKIFMKKEKRCCGRAGRPARAASRKKKKKK